MKKKIRIYMLVFILMIPILYFIAKYNTYRMLTWTDITGTYLSSPLGKILNLTQTHTYIFLWPMYFIFLFLLFKEYQNISVQEYIIMIAILIILAVLNLTVLSNVFLPAIWWSWSDFAIVHAVTLAVFAYLQKKICKRTEAI